MRSKYKNKRQVVDGYHFDSQAEASYYGQLKLLLTAGQIKDLEIHPRFPLEVNGQKICTYVADFRFTDVGRGTSRIVDVKGMRTAAFILKKKLLKACHGIDVEEVKAKRNYWDVPFGGCD